MSIILIQQLITNWISTIKYIVYCYFLRLFISLLFLVISTFHELIIKYDYSKIHNKFLEKYIIDQFFEKFLV